MTALGQPALYHTGLVVDDLEVAMSRYSDLFGFQFAEPLRNPGSALTSAGILPAETLLTYSRGHEHGIELIQYINVPAYAELPQGTRTHHLGFWVDDLGSEIERFEKAGLHSHFTGVDEKGDASTYSYHFDEQSGLWMELISTAIRPRIERWRGTGVFTVE